MSNHFFKTNLLIFIFVATRLLLHLSDHFHGHGRDFAAIGGYSLLSPEVTISQSQRSLFTDSGRHNCSTPGSPKVFIRRKSLLPPVQMVTLD